MPRNVKQTRLTKRVRAVIMYTSTKPLREALRMRKGDQSRRELTARATAMFDERGYESVSMRDIAQSLTGPRA